MSRTTMKPMFKSRNRRRVRPRPGSYRPQVLVLEDRNLPGFLAPLNFEAGGYTISVAVGDFNGDSIPDLVTANSYSSTVSVLLGNGDGTFRPAVDYGVGGIATSVAVRDLRGNGKLDLIVGDEVGLHVLLGNGDGTFQAAHRFGDYDVGYGSVAVGDFNNDGKLDIAALGQMGCSDYGCPSPDVEVFLGNGDGTFQPPLHDDSVPIYRNEGSLAVGDFNGDGALDLAVVNGGDVSVLLGNGDGTFQPPLHYAVGVDLNSVAVGDFNGDGALDLAVGNVGHSGSGSVSVLLGNGDGTFQAAINYGTAAISGSVAVGDFNGDGVPDLAVPSQYTFGGFVNVRLGNGDGTFQPSHGYAIGTSPRSVAVADFNGDGWPDLAVANFLPSDVSILLNDGTWPSAPGGGSGPHAGHGGMNLPALTGVLPPRPDPLALPAAPNRGTEPALPPPLAAVDGRFAEAPVGGLAGVTARPMLPRSPATWLPVLDSDLPRTDGMEWLA